MIEHEAVPPSPNSSRRQRRRNERVELDVDERWALLSHGPGARRGGERKHRAVVGLDMHHYSLHYGNSQ